MFWRGGLKLCNGRTIVHTTCASELQVWESYIIFRCPGYHYDCAHAWLSLLVESYILLPKPIATFIHYVLSRRSHRQGVEISCFGPFYGYGTIKGCGLPGLSGARNLLRACKSAVRVAFVSACQTGFSFRPWFFGRMDGLGFRVSDSPGFGCVDVHRRQAIKVVRTGKARFTTCTICTQPLLGHHVIVQLKRPQTLKLFINPKPQTPKPNSGSTDTETPTALELNPTPQGENQTETYTSPP